MKEIKEIKLGGEKDMVIRMQPSVRGEERRWELASGGSGGAGNWSGIQKTVQKSR